MTSWHRANDDTEYHPKSGIRLCEMCKEEITLANTKICTRANVRICGRCYLKKKAQEREAKGLK